MGSRAQPSRVQELHTNERYKHPRRTKEFSATLCNQSLHLLRESKSKECSILIKTMVVVGEVIVTKIIEKLVEIGFNYAADRYFAQDTRMKVELGRLKKALPRIKAVVEMAESGQQEINEGLNEWLWQLKDALDEADNVLDELDYLRLQKQVKEKASGSKEHAQSGRGKVHAFFSDSKRKVEEVGKRVVKSDPTLKKLRGAVKRLDEVAADVGNFISTLQGFKQLEQQRQTRSTVSTRETGPALTESKVFGRDEERKELLEWLRKDESSTSVSLFSIIGLGGVGKTTLTQLVYNDESLANSFDRKIWVCISTPFDVKKVMADMIEYATGSRPKVKSFASLQQPLIDLVSSKKFLLVLDDAWNDDNCDVWVQLFAPLKRGHKGSKILLTTRIKAVAKMAASALGGSIKEPMELKPLDDANFLSLFNRYAFDGVNPCDYGELEPIGEQIAKRLGRLPLAAKTIGALLNSNLDRSHWTTILLSRNISDQDQARQSDGVMSILKLSYHHLPMRLRPCFAYCSIFPQDYWFSKDDLVFMWMALGFIQQSPSEAPEDTGRGYFDDLVKLSFLEPAPYKAYKEEQKYIMHDLLHDMAHKVSQDECFRFVGDTSIDQIPNTVRHLYFETDKLDLLKDVGKRKNLRTLVLVFRGYVNVHAEAFEDVFKSLESIRVLRLAVDGMNILPDAIGSLRHIRYLSILHDVSQLPNSFCKLYQLQVLAGGHFGTQSVLGLNNLISLRHLMPCEVYYEKVEGIGTLTSLQRFAFAANVYKLSELKDLRDLRELKIRGLKYRKHHEEVSMIELQCKKNLLELELVWSDDSVVVDEYEQMLDRLQPPDSLKELTIKGYQGARSPCWMQPAVLKNLEYISLEFGRAWKHLPPLGKLPYLMHLTLRGLPALQQINCEGGFQRLKYLYIYGCEQWEEWSGLEAEAVRWCPLLQQLFITYCPKLKALPPLPLNLRRLELGDVGLSDSPTFWVGSNCSGSSCSATSFSSASSPSLSELSISTCVELTSVAGLFRHHLKSLRDLDIRYCKELVDLHAEEGLRHLCAIEHMGITNCPKLKMAPDIIAPIDRFPFSSLRSLWLVDCGELDSLTPTLLMQSSLTSLSWLKLGGAYHITPFPSKEACRRFTSLEWVDLEGCRELTSIERLKALPHLSRLSIHYCPKLVQAAEAATSASIKLEEEQEFTSTVRFLNIDDPFLLRIEPLRKLRSVISLEIEDCSDLEAAHTKSWLLQNSTSLQYLCLWNVPKFLPSSLQTLPSLEQLTLANAYELQSLPQLPLSLRELHIWNCSETLKERCHKNEGADWPNIRHIPQIEIDLAIREGRINLQQNS